MIAILVILAIFLAVIFAGIAIYNKLIRLKNTVKSSWSDIDVQLKKRYDLVPNLVETVKGYATHERGVFENVAKARSMAMHAAAPADKAKAENMLCSSPRSASWACCWPACWRPSCPPSPRPSMREERIW